MKVTIILIEEKLTKLIFSFLLPFLLLCGRAGKTVLQPRVGFRHLPIAYRETCLYETVKRDCTRIAIRKMETTKVQYGKTPAFEVTSIEQLTEDSPPVESTVVYISRENMTPLASFHYSRPPRPLVTIAVGYQEEIAEIVTATKEGQFKRDVPIGVSTFDIHQIPTLGRAIRFSQQLPYQIHFVIPQKSRVDSRPVVGKIRYGGIDTVTTPAGRFECYKLVFETDTTKKVLWFERIGARRLIQSYDSTNGETVRLISSSAIPIPSGLTGATVDRPSHILSAEPK